MKPVANGYQQWGILAKQIPGVLPPFALKEVLETTKIPICFGEY